MSQKVVSEQQVVEAGLDLSTLLKLIEVAKKYGPVVVVLVKELVELFSSGQAPAAALPDEVARRLATLAESQQSALTHEALRSALCTAFAAAQACECCRSEATVGATPNG